MVGRAIADRRDRAFATTFALPSMWHTSVENLASRHQFPVRNCSSYPPMALLEAATMMLVIAIG